MTGQNQNLTNRPIRRVVRKLAEDQARATDETPYLRPLASRARTWAVLLVDKRH